MTEAQRDLLWLLHLHDQAAERARRRLEKAAKRFGQYQTNAANVRMCAARIRLAEALRAQREIAAAVECVRRQLRGDRAGRRGKGGR